MSRSLLFPYLRLALLIACVLPSFLVAGALASTRGNEAGAAAELPLPTPGRGGLQKADELSRAFRRWIKDFGTGKLGAGKVKKAYLTDKLLDQTSLIGRPRSILIESRELLKLARERGRASDAALFLEALEVARRRSTARRPAPMDGALRRTLRTVISGRACPSAIQSALVDRVRRGMPHVDGDQMAKRASGDVGPDFVHGEPDLAADLIPLIASFRNFSFRAFFEELTHARQSSVQVAAAEALGYSGSGAALRSVARVLGHIEDPADVTRVSSSLSRLVEAKKPAPQERDLRYVLGVSLERLKSAKSWRVRMGLLPITRKIRSVTSIPVLIDLLVQGKAAKNSRAKGDRPFTGTFLQEVNDILEDLTGFYARLDEPEKWQKFWVDEQDRFRLAPARTKEVKQGETVSKGFFGIPVTGTQVVFVLDISGSMSWPAWGETVSMGPGRRPDPSKYESKLKRAKKELLKAVKGLSPDARFNVVFFESTVKTWRRKLVLASKKNKQGLERYLDKVHPLGGTSLYDGLNQGLKIQVPGRAAHKKAKTRYPTPVDEVFLLSDGSPSPGIGELWDVNEILARVRKWNLGAHVRINTVFLRTPGMRPRMGPGGAGGPRKPVATPERFMRQLAAQNYGKFNLH